jgi:hypothetical protein
MRRISWIAAVLIGITLLVACGSDDNKNAAAPPASDAAPPRYKVTATEVDGAYKFDVPPNVKGGVVSFELASAASNQEPHDFQLVRLPTGHTLDDLLKQVSSDSAPLEAWLKSGAGVGTVAPGSSATATFELAPNAQYAFFCTEASEQIGPHSTHGMSGAFTTGAKSGASLPTGSATVTASEYKFDAVGLKAGDNTIAFENGGTMLHHLLMFPILPGKTLDEVRAAFASQGPPTGPPPVDFEKSIGSAVAGPGESIVYKANLEAGRYAAVCFLPDPGTAGPPHVVKGMLTEIDVK